MSYQNTSIQPGKVGTEIISGSVLFIVDESRVDGTRARPPCLLSAQERSKQMRKQTTFIVLRIYRTPGKGFNCLEGLLGETEGLSFLSRVASLLFVWLKTLVWLKIAEMEEMLLAF